MYSKKSSILIAVSIVAVLLAASAIVVLNKDSDTDDRVGKWSYAGGGWVTSDGRAGDTDKVVSLEIKGIDKGLFYGEQVIAGKTIQVAGSINEAGLSFEKGGRDLTTSTYQCVVGEFWSKDVMCVSMTVINYDGIDYAGTMFFTKNGATAPTEYYYYDNVPIDGSGRIITYTSSCGICEGKRESSSGETTMVISSQEKGAVFLELKKGAETYNLLGTSMYTKEKQTEGVYRVIGDDKIGVSGMMVVDDSNLSEFMYISHLGGFAGSMVTDDSPLGTEFPPLSNTDLLSSKHNQMQTDGKIYVHVDPINISVTEQYGPIVYGSITAGKDTGIFYGYMTPYINGVSYLKVMSFTSDGFLNTISVKLVENSDKANFIRAESYQIDAVNGVFDVKVRDLE